MFRRSRWSLILKLQRSLKQGFTLFCFTCLCQIQKRPSCFLLPPSSSLYLLPRQGAVWIAALPHRCSAKAGRRASILSSQGLHQAKLSHLPGSSFFPTHTLTGGFYFSLVSIFSQSEAKMTVHSPELSSLHFQHEPG